MSTLFPIRFRPFGDLLCGYVLVGGLACMASPGANNQAANTQTAVGTMVPGADSPTLGTVLGAVVAGDLAHGLHAGGKPPAAPNVSHVAFASSVSPATAPDLCLAVSAGYTAVALQSCSDAPSQKWVLINGLLQGVGGTCLAVDPAQNNAAVLAPCNGSDPTQLMLRSGGLLSTVGMSNSMYLQVESAPATTATKVSFGALNLANTTQQYWSLVQRTHDSNQALVTKGVTATVLEEGGMCLGAQSLPAYVPCASDDANQRWLLLDDGFVRNERSNLCLGLLDNALAMLPCQNSSALFWGIQSGVMYDANSTCLDVSQAAPALKACDFSTSRHFIFGLSKGL